MKFANTSDAPDTTARSITFKVTDNEGTDSTVLTESVAVNAVNDTPVVTLDAAGGNANNTGTFTESDGPDANNNQVAFTNGTTNLVDPDSDITDVKISIASNTVTNDDQLLIAGQTFNLGTENSGTEIQ